MERGQGKTESSSGICGVPLGGIGAGCIEFGRDARFRNITINNNRTSTGRIPVAEGSFCAVRVSRRGKVLARILHPDTGLPFEGAGILPTYTSTEQLSWRGLYPCSHYRFREVQFPVEVAWTAFSPIIPHNVAASALPAVLLLFHLRNITDATIEASVLLNWENLCGCARDMFPEHRGAIQPVFAKPTGDLYRERGAEPEPTGPPLVAGLWLGSPGPYSDNAQGNYCVVADPLLDTHLSVMNWNEREPDALAAFWERFYHEGHLGNDVSDAPEKHSGALCCTVTLQPGEARGITMAISWHCPRFVVDGTDMGNGYTGRYADALAVAGDALRNSRAYLRAVDDWQRLLLQSSLPDWLSKALVNCNSVLSTNSLFTKNGRFGMMESLSDPFVGALDRRLYSSIATLLFFPELEQRELTLLASVDHPQEPGRAFRYLGSGCLHHPHDGPHADRMLSPNIALILQVYRNFQMTGDAKLAKTLMPRLEQAMNWILAQDQNGDGLPESDGCSTIYDAWRVWGANSYTSSLWIAALRAFARMARLLGDSDAAERYEHLAPSALASLEERLWDHAISYYRFCARAEDARHGEDPGAACHTGQAAGEWYGDFLCLGHLLPSKRVRKALEAVCTLNERKDGVREGAMPEGGLCRDHSGVPPNTEADCCWPGVFVAHFSCLLIMHGYPDRGLFTAMNAIRTIHYKHGRLFDVPLCWDLEGKQACGLHHDRHISTASLWHVLFALQGFFLSVPEKCLWLRPNLPRGIHALSVPLFTPLGIGWLKFAEEAQDGYRLHAEITFDVNVPIADVVVRLPNEVEQVIVQCRLGTNALTASHEMFRDGTERLLKVRLSATASLHGTLTLDVDQTQGQRVAFANHNP